MGPTSSVLRLLATATSVARARHHVVSVLRINGWDECRIDEVALITSELATNAVEHACTPFTLVLDLREDRLRIDVRDASTAPPRAAPAASPMAIGGRGLALVTELAHRWGCDEATDGKSVWFEVRTPQADR